MSTSRVVGAAALVLAAGMLAGCTINIGAADHHGGPGIMSGPNRGPDEDDGMMGGSDSTEFSQVDLMFARMMIPHHQQAIDMSDLALEKSTDPDVRALAEQIRAAQAPEIEQMQGWLDESGLRMPPGDAMGMGMGMGGMLSDAEMAELENATGTAFDRLYLEGMITHHEGAIQMTQMILGSRNPEVRALGEAIVESQTAEIELMEQLLDG
jgi:uncharacterized protein (DUF305 family)